VDDSYNYGLTVQGQGKTVLNVNDQSLSDGASYAISSNSVVRTTLPPDYTVPTTLTLDYSGISKLNMIGGSGGNTFALEGAVPALTSINGGKAPAGEGNWLDFSSFNTPVSVNLATGSATSIDNGAAGAVTNIQNVFGGEGGSNLIGDSQGNILVGGSGDDTIKSGSGRSILIGDGTSGQITDGSTSGCDILIGGTTSYDSDTPADMTALMGILAEWQSSASYANRVNAIDNGTIAGGYRLNYGTTVQSDSTANVLSGTKSATARDWFFAGSEDQIVNKESSEDVNNN
jgi:hypothetical protein